MERTFRLQSFSPMLNSLHRSIMGIFFKSNKNNREEVEDMCTESYGHYKHHTPKAPKQPPKWQHLFIARASRHQPLLQIGPFVPVPKGYLSRFWNRNSAAGTRVVEPGQKVTRAKKTLRPAGLEPKTYCLAHGFLANSTK